MNIFGVEVIKSRVKFRRLIGIIYVDIEVTLDDAKKRYGEKVDILNECWGWPGRLRMTITRTPMFTAAIFTKAKVWKQPKCLSMDECIQKM